VISYYDNDDGDDNDDDDEEEEEEENEEYTNPTSSFTFIFDHPCTNHSLSVPLIGNMIVLVTTIALITLSIYLIRAVYSRLYVTQAVTQHMWLVSLQLTTLRMTLPVNPEVLALLVRAVLVAVG
jgi:hypothetical protein